jgi:hypothetical protein
VLAALFVVLSSTRALAPVSLVYRLPVAMSEIVFTVVAKEPVPFDN